MKALVVVDMQNDFIDGALGTKEAAAIVPKVVEKIRNFDGMVLYTRDTHEENYLDTQEGKKLPVVHCVKGTKGWELHPEIEALRTKKPQSIEEALSVKDPVDKPTFGSTLLGQMLRSMDEEYKLRAMGGLESVTFVGLCTDICVISNAMIAKAFIPEVPIIVDAACCAGVTPESHKNALEAMKMCQIICE